jgi:hypothetical protein
MPVILVEGITDRSLSKRWRRSSAWTLRPPDIEIVPIGGAQAIRRAFTEYE